MAGAEQEDWTYKVARIAKYLGFNEMRVRWRLMQFQKRRQQADDAAEYHRDLKKYEHQICPRCGALNDQHEKDCVRCKAAMPSKAERAVAAFGVSPTMALGLAIIGIYVHMLMVESGGRGFLQSFSIPVWLEFGASEQGLVRGGAWWRLLTSMFIHGDLMHVGFNTYALFVVGPALERIFGRSRVVTYFLVTGLIASLASTYGHAWMAERIPSAGASGALMGWIGVAAGWGHRQKTPFGTELRNQMLGWGGFVIVAGLFMNSDNWAHAGGLVAGFPLGFLPDRRGRGGPLRVMGLAVDAVSVVVIAATVIVVAVPLTSYLPSGTPSSELRGVMSDIAETDEGESDPMVQTHLRQRRACELHQAGQDEAAFQTLRGMRVDLDRVCESVARKEEICRDPESRRASAAFCEAIERGAHP